MTISKHRYTLLGLIALSGSAWAVSPIPTFDKEAVTQYPYMRTGDQRVASPTDSVSKDTAEQDIPKGNTGTEQDPAFFVKEIQLTGATVEDPEGILKELLQRYTWRSVKVSEFSTLTDEIAEACRRIGYTIPLAVIPPQEVKNGVLEVQIYLAAYDHLTITENTSRVRDSWLAGYVDSVKKGEVIRDAELESIINNINDLPGVRARALLSPGTMPGTTGVDVEVQDREIWNSYVYADNGGGYYSGRYRLGVNAELNNPLKIGDKIIISGMVTDEETTNYSVRYEFPVGHGGTRWGVAYSQTNYEFTPNDLYDTLGESEGFSFYGLTPLLRSRAARLTLIYGYDDRAITDEYNFRADYLSIFDYDVDKDADVFHVGVSGSYYAPNHFFQYNVIYWNGDIKTDGGAYYDGTYQKITGEALKIFYDGDMNYRFHVRAQHANRALDGSEQFFLGGINGVRAYANGDGYGDSGYIATAEVRHALNFLSGLEAAVFVDYGAAYNRAADEFDHLAGAGIGLRYAKPDDWFAQLDIAHKIDGRDDRVEPGNNDLRIWLQVYKMF